MLVGITGNIGTGKSTLRRVFSRMGYQTFDADEIVEELYKKPNVVSLIAENFGSKVIVNGVVDKKALSKEVFGSMIKLKRLNQIIHPLVAKKISEIKHKDTICFVEVPLLFEAKLERLFDKIILVRASHETCKSRAINKGLLEDEFEKRVAVQFVADRVSNKADFVVDSDTNITELNDKALEIVSILEKIQKR